MITQPSDAALRARPQAKQGMNEILGLTLVDQHVSDFVHTVLTMA